MISPEHPVNEKARLAALRQLGLLDTAPEESFDRITRLAQRVMGTPIALVSLIDADRQWFKSNQGPDAIETARDVSFCGHAIHSPNIFEVPDATLDERFSDNPLVVDGPEIRFYAGCPIAAPDGSLIGTLCVIDNQPRSMTEADNETLRDLGAIIEQELLLRQSAIDDELTGLSNRRGFYLVGEQTLALCGRQQVPALVLYADVDGLKAANDTHGHAAGDELLRAVSEVFRASFRDADVVARIGGDEFAALLANYDSQASVAIQRFQDGLAAANTASSPGAFRLSVAVGTACFDPAQPSTLDELICQADADMYLAKQANRLTASDT